MVKNPKFMIEKKRSKDQVRFILNNLIAEICSKSMC